MFQGFLNFIREQGVMGLAIGFILGASVNEVVKGLVEFIINPLVGLIWQTDEGLTSLTVGVVELGAFISVLIDFVIIAAVVYFVFRGLKLEKVDLKKDKK